VSGDVAKLAPVVSADGHCPPVHGVSEYQERPLLTWTDTGPAGAETQRPGRSCAPRRSPAGQARSREKDWRAGKIAG